MDGDYEEAELYLSENAEDKELFSRYQQYMKKQLLVFLFFLSMSFVFSQKSYVKNYYDNGLLKEEGWLEGNLKVDYWFFYNANGTKKEEGHYLNNQRVKWWIFYDGKGKILKKSEFENNKLNGFTIVYDKNKIIRAEEYTMNKKTNQWESVEAFKKDNPFLFFTFYFLFRFLLDQAPAHFPKAQLLFLFASVNFRMMSFLKKRWLLYLPQFTFI